MIANQIIVLKFLRIRTINDFLPMNDKVLMCIVASLLAAPVGVSANKVANDVLAVQKAQQTIYQIKGMVTDSNGDPLPGVTVSVK